MTHSPSRHYLVGTMAFLDTRRLSHAAGNIADEWHTKKPDLDLRVGQILTLEYGAGRTFYIGE
jgi:hypothetical protein